MPTVLSSTASGIWISGQVSNPDPDYFYIAPPSGMRFKSLTLESYDSVDSIAFIALQQGSQFTAGYDTSQMLFWSHLGPGDLSKNFLEGLSDKAQGGITLWVNQTGRLTEYLLAFQFEEMQGKDILGTPTADRLNGTDAAERLFGFLANDTLEGGLRGDTIDGGDGLDTALYQGICANFSLRLESSGIATVDYIGPAPAIYPPLPTEGRDTLISIERLQFADKTVPIESKAHRSYADLPDTLYQFFVVGFGAAPGVTYMDQMAEAYRYWLPQLNADTVKQIVEVFTTKTQFTSVYPQALYRMEGGKYYVYAHDQTQADKPLVRGNEVTKAAFDAQMASLAQGLVETVVKTSASQQSKALAAAQIQATIGLGGDLTIGKVIYTVFGNLAGMPLTDPSWGGTAKQFANQVAVAKYYTDTLSQSNDDVSTLRSVMAAVSNTSDISSPDAIVSLIGVGLGKASPIL